MDMLWYISTSMSESEDDLDKTTKVGFPLKKAELLKMLKAPSTVFHLDSVSDISAL